MLLARRRAHLAVLSSCGTHPAVLSSCFAGGDSTELLEEELDAQTRQHDVAGLVSLVVLPRNERCVLLLCVGARVHACGREYVRSRVCVCVCVCAHVHTCVCVCVHSGRTKWQKREGGGRAEGWIISSPSFLPPHPHPHPHPHLFPRPRRSTSKDKLVAVKGQLVTVTETLGGVPNGTSFTITTRPCPDLDRTNLVIGRVVEGLDVVDRIAALPRVKNNKNSPFFQAGKLGGDKRANVAERSFDKPFSKVVVERSGVL
jgi:hypothetical protein